MKNKISTIAIVLLFAFASTSVVADSTDDNDDPPIKVVLEVWKLDPFKIVKVRNSIYYGDGWYLVKISIKNLRDKWLNLGVGISAGGFSVLPTWLYGDEPLYRKPPYGCYSLIGIGLILRPHQTRAINMGLWNTNWHTNYTVNGIRFFRFYLQGFVSSYEYNGKTYPPQVSEDILIIGIDLDR